MADIRKTATAPNKATWEMSPKELAQVFATHFGYRVRGNWIQAPEGRAVAVGWDHFAKKLTAKGWIRAGAGVNWRKAGETPRLSKVTRTAHGYWI